MEKLEHPLWIVQAVNAVLGPIVAAALAPFGFHLQGPEVIPPYIVMTILIVAAITVMCLVVRSRLSVEHPSRFQIVLEDAVVMMNGMIEEWIGPGTGRRYLPLISALGLFILIGNYAGLVPGLMAPTSSINVTLGCALTIWVYYHFEGIRKNGIVAYVKHFWAPPGAPWWIGFVMFPIEIISHTSRIMSLSLRLFGNIFGEELVILILGSIIPFIVPVPMMLLGLITGGLQAFIFVLLSIIYLQGAVAVEHEHDDHGHDAPSGVHAPASA
ncbi:MAG TPA: F0F1 ATP synthase subunit A [Vicinamibacterales bacterium]|jgi:F-type H+-transporting ATPase subunit a|nr:F0F1 ATP synthase subunit A [Vicinamibacterales bacterium]